MLNLLITRLKKRKDAMGTQLLHHATTNVINTTMRTMTMPSATEAILLQKMTIHPKQSCRTQMGSLYAPGGAIGIAALGRR